jgi:phthiocerol/phenolphthiocerol synthesis type-I polyketide synthase D
LTHQGVVPFTPKQGVELLERILLQDPVQVMALSMDWATLLSSYSPPLLSELAEEVAKRSGPAKSKRTKGGLAREKLLAAEPRERPALMEAFLREQIAEVLRCSASKLDPHQPLNKLGIDSLMAVELKNRVEADLEMAIPVTALLQGPSLAQLATLLLDQLPTPASTPLLPPITRQETPEQLLARVDQLSDKEVESLLHGMVEGEESDTPQEAPEQERIGA